MLPTAALGMHCGALKQQQTAKEIEEQLDELSAGVSHSSTNSRHVAALPCCNGKSSTTPVRGCLFADYCSVALGGKSVFRCRGLTRLLIATEVMYSGS